MPKYTSEWIWLEWRWLREQYDEAVRVCDLQGVPRESEDGISLSLADRISAISSIGDEDSIPRRPE